jgi:hypothetical protein
MISSNVNRSSFQGRPDPWTGSSGNEARWMAVQQLLRDAGLNDARSPVAYQVVETRQTADRRLSRRFPVPIAFAGLIGLAMIRAVATDPSLAPDVMATPGQRPRSRPARRAVDLQRDVRLRHRRRDGGHRPADEQKGRRLAPRLVLRRQHDPSSTL